MINESLIQNIESYQLEVILNDYIIQNYKQISNMDFDDYIINNYIKEFKLKTKEFDWNNVEVEYIYACDNYDISRFCFPLGISKPLTKYNIDLIVDEQIAWNRFFIQKNTNSIYRLKKSIYMFNEHAEELDKLHRIVLETDSIVDSWNIILNEINKISKNDNDFRDIIANIKNKEFSMVNKYIPLLISLFLGFGENKILDFIAILKNIISKRSDLFREFENPEIAHIFYEAFTKSEGDLNFVTKKMHPVALNHKNTRFNGEFNNEEYDKEKASFNTLMDCYVLDRVLELNAYFAKPDTISLLGNKRYIVKLLSSTATSKFIAFESKLIRNKLSKVGELPVDIVLNVEMLYFDLIINSYNNDEKKSIKDKLLQLINYYYGSFNNLEKVKLHEKTMNKIIQIRRELENTNLIGLAIENKSRILDGVQKIQNIVENNLEWKVILDHLLKISSEKVWTLKEIVNKAIEDSKNYKIYHTCVSIIQEGWNSKEDFQPFRSDEDIVIGLNHIYPLLLRSFEERNMIVILRSLQNIIIGSNYDGSNKNNPKAFEALFNQINKGVFEANIPYQFQSRLILYFIVMFLYPFPFLRKDEKDENHKNLCKRIKNELISEVHNDINTINLLLSGKNSRTILNREKTYDLLKDFIYFQINMLRYFGKYNESIKVGEDFFNKLYVTKDDLFESSPRIHHSMFLSYYSKFIDSKTYGLNEIQIEENRAFNNHFESARKGYERNYPMLGYLFSKTDRINFNQKGEGEYSYGDIEINKEPFPVVFFSYLSIKNAMLFFKILKFESEFNFKINLKKDVEDLQLIGNDLKDISDVLDYFQLGINGFSEYAFVTAYYYFISARIQRDESQLNNAKKLVETCKRLEYETFKRNPLDKFKLKIDMLESKIKNIEKTFD